MSLVTLHSLPANHVLEADVCIAGGGPAGISIALALHQSNIRTILLEAGGLQASEESQSLYSTDSIGLLPYSGLYTRHRQFGGSSNCWSGWCRPLDPIDFDPSHAASSGGWPIAYHEYARFLARAHELCELGEVDYRLDTWRPRLRAPYSGFARIQSPLLRDGVWQHSPPTRFGQRYRSQLEKSGNCLVVLHANITTARLNGRIIQHLRARNLEGKQITVKARHYVLACGGIENARLLMTMNEAGRTALGNDFDQVGRHFTDHAIIHDALTVFPTGDALRLYVDMVPVTTAQPGTITPWLGLQSRYLESSQLLNATWRLQSPEPLAEGEQLNRLVWRALSAAHTGTPSGFGKPSRMGVVAIINHQPNPDSRILLSRRVDALGTPTAVIDWRLATGDLPSLHRSLTKFSMEIMRLGIARCSPVKPAETAGTLTFWPGNHHYGTTRMSEHPAHGVVDTNCRVHSVDNLYVAGSSTFPTPGAATPTLSVVALALRLADHLRTRV